MIDFEIGSRCEVDQMHAAHALCHQTGLHSDGVFWLEEMLFSWLLACRCIPLACLLQGAFTLICLSFNCDQAVWERKHLDILHALPGWNPQATATQPPSEQPPADTQVLRWEGGKVEKVKKLSRQDKMAAAGSARRLTKALLSLLSLSPDPHGGRSTDRGTLMDGGMAMERMEVLLVAHLGMPLPKILALSGEKGATTTLRHFIVSDPHHFTVDATGVVSLARGQRVREGELHSSASARILLDILSKQVGVR